MHRVELKAFLALPCRFAKKKFLMHRVELKGTHARLPKVPGPIVPNAPCGVERAFLCGLVGLLGVLCS